MHHYDLRPFPLTTEALKQFVRHEVTQALHALLQSEDEPNLAEMSEQEFEAFIARVMDEKE